MEKAVELLDQCRMEIDSESSIAFDPSNAELSEAHNIKEFLEKIKNFN